MPRKARIDARPPGLSPPGIARPPRLLGWRAGLRRSRWRTWRLAMAGRPLVHCIISSAVRKLGYKCSDVAETIGISAATVSVAFSPGSKLSGIGKIQRKILETKAFEKLMKQTYKI